MAEQRLKGQEVEVRIIVDGVLSDAFTSIGSFNETLKLEKKEEGFLGETTNRYDEIFNGFDGAMEIQVSNQRWMQFQAQIKSRARREQPNLQFNVVVTDFYPNGDTPTRTYVDVFFGPQPRSVASRGDYVKVSLDFSSSDSDDNLDAIP